MRGGTCIRGRKEFPRAGSGSYSVPLDSATVVRATSKTVEDSPGHVVTVGANLPAIGYRGLLVEVAHTNLLLRNRDLSNASWTKSNATAVKTATGADGVANAASTLSATAANGYAAQVLTASANRTTSVYLKRRTGSGTVAISRNGGANYTDVTSQVSASYARVSVTSTVTNPEIRIRLGTSGDAVDVDYFQDESGDYAHSAIETAAASATCDADVVTSPYASLPTTSGEVAVTFTPLWSAASGNEIYDSRATSGSSGTAMYILGDILNFVTNNGAQTTTSSSVLTWVAGQAYALRATWGAGNVYLYRDGVLVASVTDGSANMPDANTAFRIGAAFTDGFQTDGHLASFSFTRA